ncbi:ribbon-helix-helix protein, CopG family [Nostoc sp. FACHB-87]|nr:ribbon-helix-helix protein, CopG family [Nostoc sp. FACHB-87]MBD2479242.1 ribbon-helix-helix protein, CopG family [Anabaena sp. FACHB-83]
MQSKIEISLPAELLKEVKAEAARSGRTMDKLIRASIRVYLYNKNL